MKASCVIILALVIVAAAEAQESSPRAATVPQPRTRLDPTTRTAVADQKVEAKRSSDSVVTMTPFVVKSTLITTDEPDQEKYPTGPFSLLSGGWMARKDTRGARFEVGVWPYRNILWKDERFKSDKKH